MLCHVMRYESCMMRGMLWMGIAMTMMVLFFSFLMEIMTSSRTSRTAAERVAAELDLDSNLDFAFPVL